MVALIGECVVDQWGPNHDELPRHDRLPREFEALIIVVEEYPLDRSELRLRAETLLGYPMTDRTFRRHLLRAVRTGCAEPTATGFRLPSDTLSCDIKARDAIRESRMLKEDGYEPGDFHK
jgi:hypothetical protein